MDEGWQGRRSCGDENRVRVNSQACMAAEPLRDQMAETTVAALSYIVMILKEKKKGKLSRLHSRLNT
jgi:hypothetical protein